LHGDRDANQKAILETPMRRLPCTGRACRADRISKVGVRASTAGSPCGQGRSKVEAQQVAEVGPYVEGFHAAGGGGRKARGGRGVDAAIAGAGLTGGLL
jgi:hypothetical protein